MKKSKVKSQNSKLQFKTKSFIRDALVEDVGAGDITTLAVVPKEAKAKGRIIAKQNGVIAGLDIAREVFKQIDKRIKFQAKVKDGSEVNKGKVIAEVSGPARGILTGERVALNFLQHLSGIASLTRGYKLKTKVILLDTRKTIPGMRLLEKYAVKCGGGTNHRMGLYDAILIKDNHIAIAGGVKRAIVAAVAANLACRQAGLALPSRPIEIEAKTLGQVKQIVAAKLALPISRILLDNMNLKTMRKAVKICKRAGIKTEASGGVNLDNVRSIAKTGVDYISVGALTHSAPALDISLEII